jgi:hypothetical protein
MWNLGTFDGAGQRDSRGVDIRLPFRVPRRVNQRRVRRLTGFEAPSLQPATPAPNPTL